LIGTVIRTELVGGTTVQEAYGWQKARFYFSLIWEFFQNVNR
jgi:hypothetical protein